MRYRRKILYVNADLAKNEFYYTGVEFREFIEYVHIENLILLKANYFGERSVKRFEVIEGQEQLKSLAMDDIYNYGDFCFVDYQARADVQQITNMQVAELLYLAHMYEPLTTPFFDLLQNQFAYLAHDDGWFCKLYCRSNEDFVKVFEGKIFSFVNKKSKRKLHPLDDNLRKEILGLFETGILIDADEIVASRTGVEIKVYMIGKSTDMDGILNNLERLKREAREIKKLRFSKQKWSII